MGIKTWCCPDLVSRRIFNEWGKLTSREMPKAPCIFSSHVTHFNHHHHHHHPTPCNKNRCNKNHHVQNGFLKIPKVIPPLPKGWWVQLETCIHPKWHQNQMAILMIKTAPKGVTTNDAYPPDFPVWGNASFFNLSNHQQKLDLLNPQWFLTSFLQIEILGGGA